MAKEVHDALPWVFSTVVETEAKVEIPATYEAESCTVKGYMVGKNVRIDILF